MTPFNLADWLAQRDLTNQQFADYLTAIGKPTNARTVEKWREPARGCPSWLPPLIAQREALLALYGHFDKMAERLYETAQRADELIDLAILVDVINETYDEHCFPMEKIFEKHLTDRERGITGEA